MPEETKLPAAEFFVRSGADIRGPFTVAELREQASHGRIKRQDEISRTAQGPWQLAETVKGLTLPHPPPIPSSPSRKWAGGSVPKVTATPAVEAVETKVPKWRQINWRRWGPFVGVALVSYFVGREHVKYELRSAITNTFADVASKMREISGPSVGEAAVTTPGSTKAEPPQPEPLPLGTEHAAENFAISVVGAEVRKPEVKNITGGVSDAVEPAMLVTLKIRNTHERKVVEFQSDESALTTYFRMRDDVDNVVRRNNYGFGTRPVGALADLEEINPGAEARHVEVFSVPLEKTQYVVLHVDLAAFGGEGTVRFRINADQIQK